MGINTHTYWQAEFATNFQITASTYALKKKERKKKELAYVHEQAGTYTLHILVKAITVNDSLYIGCRWMEATKWQCVTPIAQPSIKRFDGASVWRVLKQQAEQEWKAGPDSLHIVTRLQIITHNRHNNGKSRLHKQKTYKIKINTSCNMNGLP